MKPATIEADGTRTHELEFPAKPGPVSVDQLTDADREALRGLGAGRGLVIDVGTFLGGSAEALLEGMDGKGRLVTLDTFTGSPESITAKVPPERMVQYALQRLARFGGQVTLIAGASISTAALFARQSADLVFIDAAHDYANCRADIAAWLPVLKPSGLMVGHDFEKRVAEDLAWDEIVERSVMEYDKKSQAHWGVIRAVVESFREFAFAKSADSSIWLAKPDWVRA